MSATIIKASVKAICSGLAAANVSANSADAAVAVAKAVEALIGADADIGVGVTDGFVTANFLVEANRHGGIAHLVDTLCSAAGWQGKVKVVDGVTWVEILMPQAEPAAQPVASQPVVAPAPVTPAAPVVAVVKPVAPVAAPVAVTPAASVLPAEAAGAFELLLTQLTSASQATTTVVAAALQERNALLATTQAALVARQECEKTTADLRLVVEDAKRATSAAQTAAQAAVAAMAAKAASSAAAPTAKADWLDNTAVKIGLGVAAAGVVAGVGYFAYQKFFGGSNVTEA